MTVPKGGGFDRCMMKTRVMVAIAAFSLVLQVVPAAADPWGPRHGPPPAGWGAPWPPPRHPLPAREVIVVYPPPPPRGAQVVYVEPAPIQAVPASDPYLDGQGRYCREYQTTVMVGGAPQPAYGTACRMPDGTWRIVR